jgi:Ca-activated chloride channel family protein
VRAHRRLGIALVLAAVVAGCTGGGDDDEGAAPEGPASGFELGDPGDCIVVDMAVSSEKVELLTDLAGRFNESDEARVGDRCAFVEPRDKASGAAATLLADGWRDQAAEGPQPVVWSPASSAWAGILNQRLDDRGEAPMAPPSEPFMLTPLVIAMPEPMADALGYPATPVGFADILGLARSPEGWAAFGHPEWGPFRLGKTNPNFSTSGLSALLAQGYAATGTTRGLSLEDLARPDVVAFGEGIESSVVHYGDITMTFLNNWFRADQRGTALTYVSAVAVEEKSLIDYNLGNPDGVLDPGEEPRPPRTPLVAVYPEEGTLFSDNPYIVLDAPWVDEDERAAAEAFGAFVQRPENQERVLEFGFRPGNPEVAIGSPIVAANGVDPAQPQATLEVPDPPVLIDLLDRWGDQRKNARVMLVLDISGSMGEPSDPSDGGGPTKLDLAKDAAINALDQFNEDDEVGLRVFSTDLGPDGTAEFLDLVPVTRIGDVREQLETRIRDQFPTNGTPLYTATGTAYEAMLGAYDPARINAVVLLSDGVNDDGAVGDDDDQLESLLAGLRAGSEGQASRPVRVFPIAYGAEADLPTLRRIAEGTNAAVYNASDPLTIDKVFTAVVSNF